VSGEDPLGSHEHAMAARGPAVQPGADVDELGAAERERASLGALLVVGRALRRLTQDWQP